MSTSVIFRGGLPYAPDLRKLNEEFPLDKLAEGTVITYDDLQKVTGYQYGTSRFYALIKSWIGHQRSENRIFIRFEPKVGLRVLNPAEIMLYGEKVVRQKIGQTARAIRIFNWVDRERLDDVGQKRLDHQSRVVEALRGAMESARKQLAVELAPIKSLPRPGGK